VTWSSWKPPRRRQISWVSLMTRPSPQQTNFPVLSEKFLARHADMRCGPTPRRHRYPVCFYAADAAPFRIPHPRSLVICRDWVSFCHLQSSTSAPEQVLSYLRKPTGDATPSPANACCSSISPPSPSPNPSPHLASSSTGIDVSKCASPKRCSCQSERFKWHEVRQTPPSLPPSLPSSPAKPYPRCKLELCRRSMPRNDRSDTGG
jgi:hypothetical protein